MKILDKISRSFFRKKSSDIPKEGTVENVAYASNLCLNCGTQLVGKYCHNCGQVMSSKEPKYKFHRFLISYFSRIYLWHPKIPFTLWTLMTRPGFLINEYISGKHTTYTDPLVFNRFFLLVLTTLFGLFSVFKVSDSSLKDIFVAGSVIGTLAEDKEYVQKMNDSPRDTIQLNTYLQLIAEFPAFIEPIDTIADMEGEMCDTLIAVVPSVWLEDKYLVGDAETGYHFSAEPLLDNEMIASDQLLAIWDKMVDLARRNIGLIVLLICPIMAFVIRLLHRNDRIHMHYFIFAMFYSGIVEVVILAAVVCSLLFGVSYNALESVILLVLWGYLTVALKKAFEKNSWFSACLKAFLVNAVFLLVIIFSLVIIMLIAFFWILL